MKNEMTLFPVHGYPASQKDQIAKNIYKNPIMLATFISPIICENKVELSSISAITRNTVFGIFLSSLSSTKLANFLF